MNRRFAIRSVKLAVELQIKMSLFSLAQNSILQIQNWDSTFSQGGGRGVV